MKQDLKINKENIKHLKSNNSLNLKYNDNSV